MRMDWFVLSVLCVWRITHLLNAEDGPGDLIVKLRRIAGDGFWGSLMDCFYCLSLWVAAPLAMLVPQTWGERLLWWPALSAGAILLERVTSPDRDAAPAIVVPAKVIEEKENSACLVADKNEHNNVPTGLVQ
jgi:hypothetical protein